MIVQNATTIHQHVSHPDKSSIAGSIIRVSLLQQCAHMRTHNTLGVSVGTRRLEDTNRPLVRANYVRVSEVLCAGGFLCGLGRRQGMSVRRALALPRTHDNIRYCNPADVAEIGAGRRSQR